jgi:DNA-binding transcriptional MerR regulator
MDADRSRLLPVGRFAELSGLTPKMLRHYDSLGLLSPALHEPDTGYRYYDPLQVREAELIRLLRDLDVSLDGIRALLEHPDDEALSETLRGQRELMRARRAEADRVIARIDRALRDERGLLPHEARLVDLEPVLVISRMGTDTLPADLDLRPIVRALL